MAPVTRPEKKAGILTGMRQRRSNAIRADLDEMDRHFRYEGFRTPGFYDRYSNVYTQRWSELPGKVLEARYRDWLGDESTAPPASIEEIVARTGIDHKTVKGVLDSLVGAFVYERDQVRHQASIVTCSLAGTSSVSSGRSALGLGLRMYSPPGPVASRRPSARRRLTLSCMPDMDMRSATRALNRSSSPRRQSTVCGNAEAPPESFRWASIE